MNGSIYGFYDIGTARYVDTKESNTVRSAGGGFRISAPRGIDIDLFYASPFDKPSVSAPSKPPSRVMLAVTLRR